MKRGHLKDGSDFEYGFENNIIWIKDLDTGGKSVTNSIEEVVASVRIELIREVVVLVQHRGVDMLNTRVIYRDTNGIWDGWDDNIGFIPLNTPIQERAIEKIKEFYWHLHNREIMNDIREYMR